MGAGLEAQLEGLRGEVGGVREAVAQQTGHIAGLADELGTAQASLAAQVSAR